VLGCIRHEARQTPHRASEPHKSYILWYYGTVDLYRPKFYSARDRTLSHLSGRRKLIETMGRDDVYRFVTGSSNGLLDIGLLRTTLSPGCFYTSEAKCHANSILCCWPCWC